MPDQRGHSGKAIFLIELLIILPVLNVRLDLYLRRGSFLDHVQVSWILQSPACMQGSGDRTGFDLPISGPQQVMVVKYDSQRVVYEMAGFDAEEHPEGPPRTEDAF